MNTPFDNPQWPEPYDPRRPERPRAPFEQRYWYIWPVAGVIAGGLLVMVLNPPGGTVIASVVAPTRTPTSTWWASPPPTSTYRPTPRKTYTYAPEPPYTPAAASTPAGSFGPGTFLVGTDLQPGTYRATVPAGEMCYWKRTKDASGSLDSIIASEIVNEGQAVVTIASSDAAFTSKRCGTWKKV